MMKRQHVAICLLWCLLVSSGEAWAGDPENREAVLFNGRIIYERACGPCHGVEGRGNGPAAFYGAVSTGPRPRDFTTGEFKLRSTATGELPLDQDLFRTITRGIPGYMPSYAGLTEEERWQVVAFIKTFSPAFEKEQPESVMMPPTRGRTLHRIAQGRRLYQQFKCVVCHGPDGTGDSALYRAGDLTDSTGLPLRPTDLTHPSSFKNGNSAADIVRTLLTGMDGTPMPSYAHNFSQSDEAWSLAFYILSLSTSSP